MQQYVVEIEKAARQDIERLHAFLLEVAPEYVDQVMERIYKSLKLLEVILYSCRKANYQNARQLRELIIDQGSSGYIALFEI